MACCRPTTLSSRELCSKSGIGRRGDRELRCVLNKFFTWIRICWRGKATAGWFHWKLAKASASEGETLQWESGLVWKRLSHIEVQLRDCLWSCRVPPICRLQALTFFLRLCVAFLVGTGQSRSNRPNRGAGDSGVKLKSGSCIAKDPMNLRGVTRSGSRSCQW